MVLTELLSILNGPAHRATRAGKTIRGMVIKKNGQISITGLSIPHELLLTMMYVCDYMLKHFQPFTSVNSDVNKVRWWAEISLRCPCASQ